MLYVDNNDVTDPQINLALEEYLLREVDCTEPLVLFYVNEPSVIIGRNQNTIEEIDTAYVQDKGIHVVRRLSGGGAVYHDLGNLNFSFITDGKDDLHNFGRFTEPVINVLQALGVAAELRGRSDVFADGKKISGNAQYATTSRMFSHGTLLFDTDLGEMLRAINPRRIEIESKAVQSIRNFVTNIRELLPQDMTIDELKAALLTGIFGDEAPAELLLTDDDWSKVEQLADRRYRTWDWNIGRSPQYNVQKSERLPVGKVDARIQVSQGRIQSVRLYGDFNGTRPIDELERLLTGVPYERDQLLAALDGVDLGPYLGGLTTDALVTFLY